MSLVEEPSQENDRKEPEIKSLEDDKTNESDEKDQKDENMRMKDLLKTNRTIGPLSLLKEEVLKVFKDKETKMDHEDRPLPENKPVSSTLDLLKEDFSQFKEDITSVFSINSSKDKETKMDHEDCPLTQAENKPVSSTLDLLKEDFSQFKEDVTSVFSINSSKDKEMKSTEKTINPLSFLKEDFNHFKDVFRIGLSKERDTAKENSSNAFKIKVSRAERTDELFKGLFRGDQKTSQRAENSQTVKETFSEISEELVDDSLRGNLSEQKDETVDAEKINNMKEQVDELEDNELDGSEEKTLFESEEVIPTSQEAEQRCECEEWSHDSSSLVSAEDETINGEEEEQQQLQQQQSEEPSLPWESLSSGISLLSLRDSNKDDKDRDQQGEDMWLVKNYACYLTFDPNTANSELHLTDSNRKATRVWSENRSLDHPDRFERCPQVLCREGLLDSVYWEVVWSGGADIGITYNSISRNGDAKSCLLGHNERSWSLECSEGSYTPCHDNKRFRSYSPRPFSRRVGVYLDWPKGSLSFYCISRDTMVHLHTFTSTFTEPLYPGFWVWAYNGSVSLCQVELDWERLLQ